VGVDMVSSDSELGVAERKRAWRERQALSGFLLFWCR
jgi:hypothetical protein